MAGLADLLSTRSYREDRGEANLTRFVDCELDGLIGQCLEPGVEQMRSALPDKDLYTLLLFAYRAVVLGLREPKEDWILKAARALAVASEGIDPRDVSWAASVVAAASTHLAVSTELVTSALGSSGSVVRQRFEASEERVRHAADPWEETLYSVATTTWGIGLVRRDIAVYSPTVDLLAVAMQIGDALDADRYLAADPTIATAVPNIWLGLKRSDSKTTGRGCASIGATDWDRSARWDRMFNIWIIESKSGRRAVKLAKRAKAVDRSHARLSVSEGTLTCIIVAQPTTVGVRPDETDESLSRFTQPCADAMRAAQPIRE